MFWSLGADAYRLRKKLDVDVTAGTRLAVVEMRRTERGTIKDERDSLEKPSLEAIALCSPTEGLEYKVEMSEFGPAPRRFTRRWIPLQP